MSSKLLTREKYADLPTERVTVILADEVLTARLYGRDAQEARALMHGHETPDMLFLRLLLFYQHANRQDSDTAMLAALERNAV